MSVAGPRPEVLALLADCKEQPDEDGLRFILADWLEENGAALDLARAELIRCQVDHARLPPEEPSRNALARRARSLQQQHGQQWLGPLAPWLRFWTCQRGLLAVAVTATTLRSRGLTALADSEAWSWVEEVRVGQANDEDLPRLARCPLLDGPTILDFASCRLGPAGLQALGKMPWLAHAVRLDLGQQPLTPSGLRAFLTSSHLGRLRFLQLPAASLGPEAADLLVEAPCSVQLRSLVLWGNRLGDQGTAGLCAGNRLGELRRLDLQGNGIGDRGARALADCAALSGLQVLDLANNQIGLEGATALATSPHLSRLAALVLWGNPVGEAGFRLLKEHLGGRVHVSPGGA